MFESVIIKEGDRYYIFFVVKENDDWSFKFVEVILGFKDGDWVFI